MAETEEIRQRIEVRVSQGSFLAGMLQVAARDSAAAQESYVDHLSRIAATVRELLNEHGYIEKVDYRPQDFWESLKGEAVGFIDGGVASVDLPSAAPIGIRVGSYIVRPGEVDPEKRESFNIELSLVDDLYGPEALVFDEAFEDIAKLRDAARIISEASAALGLAVNEEAPDFVLVHGPLINPASPYGLADFPAFGERACRTFLGDQSFSGDADERQFVAIYLEVLKRLRDSGRVVAGVVERSVGRRAVVLETILQDLEERGQIRKREAKKIRDEAELYGLNDASLFDVVLAAGEYVGPVSVNRQGPQNKWPQFWLKEIKEFPPATTVYLKPAELALPFRIETFESTNHRRLLDLVMHTSRLLPTYAFPVGLDIVDKFAKVPEWMSRGVRGQHQVVLLNKALESGDERVLTFAKRMLAAKGRDWFFRPSA